jgi:hypothetical protein
VINFSIGCKDTHWRLKLEEAVEIRKQAADFEKLRI